MVVVGVILLIFLESELIDIYVVHEKVYQRIFINWGFLEVLGCLSRSFSVAKKVLSNFSCAVELKSLPLKVVFLSGNNKVILLACGFFFFFSRVLGNSLSILSSYNIFLF